MTLQSTVYLLLGWIFSPGKQNKNDNEQDIHGFISFIWKGSFLFTPKHFNKQNMH